MRRVPVITTVVMLLAAATMVALGVWQLQRREAKAALLASYARNAALPPLRLIGAALPEDQLFRRGESFRVPGIQVDGMDVLAVRGAATTALEWVRAGKGPVLLELKTYRYRGHSMSDPAKYRSRDEVQAVREKSDPIEACKRELETLGVGEAEFKAIDAEIKKRVVEAADFAEQSPEPAPGELHTDVLVGSY